MSAMTRMLFATSPMMRGDDVLALQRQLAAAAAGPAQDGLFGDATAATVRAFQSAHRLEPDGIVGPVTWGTLFGPAAGPPRPSPISAENLRHLLEPRRYYADGVTWRLTPEGAEVMGEGPVSFSSAERTQAANVLTRFRQELVAALTARAVPVELVVATICAESGGQPVAPRMEPGCDRAEPENTPSRVSEGLMQTLLSTARQALRQPGLRLVELQRPEVSILAGATYMMQQAHQTRHDPPLVAAAYNAGSLRYNGGRDNRWRLAQYPLGTSKHVDRFLRAFNAAMQIVPSADLPASVPSFHRLLRDGATSPARLLRTPAPGGPYVARAPRALLGQVVTTGQCVAYVQVCANAPHTAPWRRGVWVKGNAGIAEGTVIATFDPDETYGNHGDGRSHAAVYLGQDGHGLTVLDQWIGQPVHQRVIRFGGERPANNGDAFHVVV